MGEESASRPHGYTDYNINELAEVLADLSHSAQEGDPEAQWGLGQLYDFGKGVGQDRREAMRLWRKAAEQGLAIAQFELGLRLMTEGVGPDHQEGIKWLKQAAKQGSLFGNGCASAHLHLGVLYEDGYRVAQDYPEAARWYTEAAQLGDRVGQYNLGLMYHHGKGVTQDDNLASSWFRKAAAQGCVYAQYALAAQYHDGLGVPKDYVEAYKWAILAVQGFPSELAEIFRPALLLSAWRRAMFVLRDAVGLRPAARVRRESRLRDKLRCASQLKDGIQEKMSLEQRIEAQRLATKHQSHD